MGKFCGYPKYESWFALRVMVRDAKSSCQCATVERLISDMLIFDRKISAAASAKSGTKLAFPRSGLGAWLLRFHGACIVLLNPEQGLE